MKSKATYNKKIDVNAFCSSGDSVNIRFLETFVWVAKLGSFRAAASQLHLTQAAISGRIAALENDVGKKIFERHGRQMRLNSAGKTLLHHAEHILRIEHDLRQELTGPTLLRGRVRLGVIESIIYTWFPHFLAQLQQQHPDVEIELTVESSRRLHDLLKRGLVDVAIQTDPVIEKGLRNTPLGRFSLSWMFAANTDLVLPTDLNQLLNEWAIVTFPRYSQPHLSLLELLESKGIMTEPRIHFASSIAAGMQLLQTGNCVGVLPTAVFNHKAQSALFRVAKHLPALTDMHLVASWRPELVTGLSTEMVKLSLSEMKNYSAHNEFAFAAAELPVFHL